MANKEAIDVDLSQFDKGSLIALVNLMNDEGLSFEEVVEMALKDLLHRHSENCK